MLGLGVRGIIRITASAESHMAKHPDKIPENIDFAAQEVLEAPADQRPVLLENIAKALTRRLLQDNPGIGIRDVSQRVSAFIEAVRARIE
jgi:hypothetical protein